MPFLTGGQGFQAFRPVFAPTGERGAPVAFVSAWFSKRRLAGLFRGLEPDTRARVAFGSTEVFATPDAPRTGSERSVALGGARWRITARGKEVSHASALAVLVGGAVLAAMLAVFTWARITSERRLRDARDSERAARRTSERLERNTAILQRLAASLSAAALPTEVAEAAVPFLFETFDARLATVGVAYGDDVRTLKVFSGTPEAERQWRPIPASASSPTADAMRVRRTVELHGWDLIRQTYPGEVEQLLAGIQSIVVAPLSRGTGAVGVGFAEERVPSEDERRMLDAIAEELTRALDRATLLESERDARLQAELMELNAERLAAAATTEEVAAATVAVIEAFGADAVLLWSFGDGQGTPSAHASP